MSLVVQRMIVWSSHAVAVFFCFNFRCFFCFRFLFSFFDHFSIFFHFTILFILSLLFFFNFLKIEPNVDMM